MRIRNVHIRNYRSIRNLEFAPHPLTVLLGPNNHGKSNIVAALDFALSTSAKPEEGDIFAFRAEDEKGFWVELTFDALTDQERNTFKRYVLNDGTVKIRKSARLTESGSIEISYNGYSEEPDEIWLKASEAGNYTRRPDAEATPLVESIPESGRLSKAVIEEAQLAYIKAHRDALSFTRRLEDGPLLGQKNVAGGVLPDFYLVPAVRDLSDEVKVKNTTTFGRLLNHAVQDMAESDPRFQQIRSELDSLMSTLNKGDEAGNRPEQLVRLENSLEEELRHWGVSVDIEVTPPEIERIFELGTNLHLDDGLRTLAERKGHGLQRAVIFGLLKAWASALRQVPRDEETVPRRASDSLVFAIEEPELFLHPHAQRALARAIQDIAETAHHQVFLCTHSTHFVDLDKYRSICIVTRETPQEGTSVRQCLEELFEGEDVGDRKKRFHMARWVNPDRGEMFFARKVVLVEGETEKALLPALAEKLGCYNPDVSVIDCGSKHNLPLYIAITNAFKLRYLVIHDEDPLPDPIPDEWDADKEREKRRTYKLNAQILSAVDTTLGEIEVLSPDFEGVAGVSRSQGKTKGKALAALEHYAGLADDSVPVRLREVVHKTYTP